MKRTRRATEVALAVLGLAFATSAQAQAPAPSPEPPRVDVTGYVDVYYGYNFNGVDPAFRSFDVQHNTFSLSAAEVAFAKAVTPDSRVGFRTDLFFGKAADLTASFEPEEDGKEIYKHIQQAYVSLLTGKVTWEVGKFVTPIGAEVIESQDNWNYTRSILFGYAIPFYHVGARATLQATDEVSLAGYVVNGWNNASEWNGEKTFIANLTVKPSPKVAFYANGITGKEFDGAPTRSLFDTTLSISFGDKLSVMGNFDYGEEGDASWWGAAAYLKLQATPGWALAGRFEYLDDSDGGWMTLGTTAKSVTVTSDHTIAGALRARLEYRADLADGDVFPDEDGGSKDSQSTFTVGLVVTFGGKI
jgi:hypothetical protein